MESFKNMLSLLGSFDKTKQVLQALQQENPDQDERGVTSIRSLLNLSLSRIKVLGPPETKNKNSEELDPSIVSGSRDSESSNQGGTEVLRVYFRKRRNMVDDSNSLKGDNIQSVSSSSSPQEGQNKGKQLADFPLSMAQNSLTEFPHNEFLKEKLPDAIKILASLKANRTEKRRVKGSFKYEWNDPIVLELEQLLSHNLGFIFQCAIKKIVEFGYTEEVAEMAILRSGVYTGLKDAKSNIVDGALAYFKNKDESNSKKVHVFEDLQSVASYTILEMVTFLREVRPDLSAAEAIWYLLICDSNLSLLCSPKVDQEMSKAILGEPNNKNASQKASLPNLQFDDASQKHPFPNLQFDDVTFNPHLFAKENTGGSRKGTPFSKKNYKGRMLGTSKARVATLENLVSVRNPNTNGDTLCEEKPNQESSLKNLDDYYAKIPYDKSLGKHVPQDEGDEAILVLLNKMKETEKDIDLWTKWANEKVMQAARGLGKDQKELKKLKAEKEYEKNKVAEMEKVLADTRSQIEVAKAAAARIEEENKGLKKEMNDKAVAVSAACEKENEAKFREQELLKKVQDHMKMRNKLKEDMTKMKERIGGAECDLDKDKARFKQEEGRKAENVREKERLLKLTETIRSEREQIIAATKISDEAAIQEAEDYKKKTEEEIKKLEAEIYELKIKAEAEKIEEIRQSIGLNLVSNGSPNLWGYGVPKVTKRLAVFEDICAEADENDECVMCLNGERTVVFLPCLHQVVCVKCNELHEKQGMKECPVCRSAVMRRIPTVSPQL